MILPCRDRAGSVLGSPKAFGYRLRRKFRVTVASTAHALSIGYALRSTHHRRSRSMKSRTINETIVAAIEQGHKLLYYLLSVHVSVCVALCFRSFVFFCSSLPLADERTKPIHRLVRPECDKGTGRPLGAATIKEDKSKCR